MESDYPLTQTKIYSERTVPKNTKPGSKAAREHGRQLDYWQTATLLLEELKEKGWDQAPPT